MAGVTRSLAFPDLSVPMIELLILGAVLACVIGLLALRNPLHALVVLIVFGVTRIDLFLPSLGPLSPSIIVETLILIGFAFGMLTRRLEFRLIGPEAHLMIVFVLVCCLSTILWGQTLYDFNGRLLFKDILVQLFVVLMLINLVREWRDVDFVAKVMAVCGLLLACMSLFQSLFGGGSWSQSQGGGYIVSIEGEILTRGDMLGIHPNELAVILGMLLPIFIYLQNYGTKSWRFLSWLGIALLVPTIASTFSRTGFLVLAFVILMSLTVNRRTQFWLTIAILGAIIIFVVPSLYWSRIGTLLTDREGSNRIFLYQAALKLIQINPVLGIGYGGYPFLVNRYYPLHYTTVSTPHNIYLEIVSETGLLNLLIYGLLFWFLLRSLKTMAVQTAATSNRAWLGIWVRTLRIGILAYLLAGLTTSVLLNSVIYVLIGLTLATKKLFVEEMNSAKLVTDKHASEPSLGLAV
ncbi:MAG: O-antigen ligase family protein, partial [candidate division KSB1 bacterium]|nr:O-antigen ligase family protein [candidate division KSB1 bacterium]MDZ7313474.1 O-antigen ligase family protein [candidate division KSB1 bacterium]